MRISFFILRFSRNQFFRHQKPVLPLFLGQLESDWAQNFFGGSSTDLGWPFFFFWWYLVPFRIGRLRKICRLQKTDQNPTSSEYCSVFWLPSLKYLEFSKKKKNGHPVWDPLPLVKISAQSDGFWGLAGGKTFCWFFRLGSLEVQEDGVWEICVYDNFCSTTRGLSTLKIWGRSVRPFPRNAGKGGGPLKYH